MLFIYGKAVLSIEIQGGFPVGTGFQGDFIATERFGDVRGFPEQRGGVSLLPVIRVSDDVLYDREGTDVMRQALRFPRQ